MSGIGAWVGFNAFVLVLLALDLGVFHRRAHAVGMREAAIWSAVWVTLALLFGLRVYLVAGEQTGLQYLTGYLLEKALAVDNVFVFVLIFGYFGVEPRLQHRVLFWGVLGALVLRGAFILAGAFALHRWHWLFYGFGALLLVAGVQMLFKRPGDTDVARNPVLRLVRRLLPLSPGYRGTRFFVRESGRRLATPLFLVLVVIEASDIVFATDSIPAIFAITQDPFIVFTSNVFAILGLRSMYFLLAGVVHRFVYLNFGLSAVLVFIGAKMLLGGLLVIPTGVSLLVVASLVALAIAASLLHPPRTQAPAAAPGGEAAEPPARAVVGED